MIIKCLQPVFVLENIVVFFLSTTKSTFPKKRELRIFYSKSMWPCHDKEIKLVVIKNLSQANSGMKPSRLPHFTSNKIFNNL